jgi:Ca2+-transporting ATPase
MGPTCSIIYENEPMEKNTMQQKPKPLTTTFFNWKELSISIVQGLIITAGTLFTYQYSVKNGYDEALTRTMTFTVLIAANIFLTLINRSFYYSIATTLRYKNKMVLIIIFITIAIMALVLFIKPLTSFFDLETLNTSQLLICIGIGFLSVIWVEALKWNKRNKNTGPKKAGIK